jgi:hypothetical protein
MTVPGWMRRRRIRLPGGWFMYHHLTAPAPARWFALPAGTWRGTVQPITWVW